MAGGIRTRAGPLPVGVVDAENVIVDAAGGPKTKRAEAHRAGDCCRPATFAAILSDDVDENSCPPPYTKAP